MRILRLDIRNFRGLRDVTIRPNGHVVLAGEPRAGRSTVVEALRRVLLPDTTRVPLTDDLDFNRRDRSLTIEIEVVLGDLGAELEQEFFDHLEPWDAEDGEVLLESSDPTELDDEDTDLVVRLCYRARWDDDGDVGEHWVDFPKSSDPSAERFTRVSRRLLQQLPFVFVEPSSRLLGLGPRSEFRRLVDGADGDDFAEAMDSLLEQIEKAAESFSDTIQVAAALDGVVESLRRPLGLGTRPGSEIVQFMPEGGSLAGVIRSLGPSLSISSSLSLPVGRHGSTTSEMLRAAEALALRGNGEAVAVVDDFGENLDVTTAVHLAALFRSSFKQSCVSTRRGAVAEVFRPDELVRLIRVRKGAARVHQGTIPTSRADRVASRHLALQLLPAIASRTVVVLEGPHDRAGLSAVAARRFEIDGSPLPAADGIYLADAGAADRSGGAGAAVKLASFAAHLGFRVVVVLDGDRAGDDAQDDAEAVSQAVIRLPRGHAIERALVDGVDNAHIRKALEALRDAFGLTLPADVATATGDGLRRLACELIKSSGGLHAQFVELLPRKAIPPVAIDALDAIRAAGRGKSAGVVQL
jgi:putative ATP-dependent endonuclease of OLD family